MGYHVWGGNPKVSQAITTTKWTPNSTIRPKITIRSMFCLDAWKPSFKTPRQMNHEAFGAIVSLRTYVGDFVYEHLLIFKFMMCCTSGSHTWSLCAFRKLPAAARASNTIPWALTALSELSHNSVSSDNILWALTPLQELNLSNPKWQQFHQRLIVPPSSLQQGSAETGGSLLIIAWELLSCLPRNWSTLHFL